MQTNVAFESQNVRNLVYSSTFACDKIYYFMLTSEASDVKSPLQNRGNIRDKRMPDENSGLPVIGWREWVNLPDLGIETVKAKVDTGARSSSLHAFDVEMFRKNEEDWVRFKVHPVQREDSTVVELESRVYDSRSVRSSSEKADMRPVIVTNVALLGVTWPVELTLANRDQMGFRMLLGRQAFRRRFLVDAGKSYLGGKAR